MQIQVLTDAEIKALNFVDLERIDYDTYELDQGSVMEFARSIEAAILAKLASAELPDMNETPLWDQLLSWEQTDPGDCQQYADAAMGVINDQLRQAHAQGFAAGAAAQLTEKPLAYFYHDASCPEMANPLLHSTLLLHVDDRNSNLKNETPLYTRREAK